VTQDFDGDTFLLERALHPEVSLVKAHTADRAGNLRFHGSARNFNPVVAMAGATTVVEVERIVDNGFIEPDDVHLPGIYVHRVVVNPSPEKRIEKRTTST
jgi:3-oxoacid CoA-transferase subunit A